MRTARPRGCGSFQNHRDSWSSYSQSRPGTDLQSVLVAESQEECKVGGDVPIVMASWYAPTIVPRIHLGAVSDWYIGIMALIRPTPRPAKKRPAMNIGRAVETVCKMTPRLNTKAEDENSPHRRPRISAEGAASRAPKKVPAERIETISESCSAVIS